MNIVLYEPEIPYNTGNIGRTCVAANAALHLIKPLGFSLEDKYIKRSGLDYWQDLNLHVYESFADFALKNPNAALYPATTKAKRLYSEIEYTADAYLIFGKESAGLPEPFLREHHTNCVRIPMFEETRSLNLSAAAAIVLYEALRQHDFPNLKRKSDHNCLADKETMV